MKTDTHREMTDTIRAKALTMPEEFLEANFVCADEPGVISKGTQSQPTE